MGVHWRRWESWAGGQRAVFAFEVPAAQARYPVYGCCTPGRNGTQTFAAAPAYRGEIAVDPSSGAILRLSVQADLQDFLPVDRSELVVDYGPVAIGGRSYILPLRSVSVGSQRSLMGLQNNWFESFWTWGPYTTQMLHFRGNFRIAGNPPGTWRAEVSRPSDLQ